MQDLDTPYCVGKMKVLADRTRLEVLSQLRGGPKLVRELRCRLGIEQTLLSHHLRLLRDAGLVESSREGKSRRYRLSAQASPEGRAEVLDLRCCQVIFPEASAEGR